MSNWTESGTGEAGQKLKNCPPLPPIQRPNNTQELDQKLDPTTTVSHPKSLRSAVFSKLEKLVQEMQDPIHGVPVRSQKLFLTSIPAAFMGYDLIEWLMDRLCIEDSPVEAVHVANLLCQFGYYFPVSEQKNLLVKDDSSLYRFQSPYFWPSQHHTPDHIEYAIYLYKRAAKNKKIHGLEPGLPDYENDALVHLKRILANRWDFVVMQAEEQLKVAKDRKKGDKIINESQEKAYWRVYKPPPGYITLVENPPVPLREQKVRARRNNKEMLKHEIQFMNNYLEVSRVRTSQVAENLLEYTDTFVEWDPLLIGCGPSNPWMNDDTTYWEINKPIPDNPTEKRVRKWAVSLEDIIMDPLGIQELLAYMKKEYSHENLRFWLAVQELKRGPGSETKIKKKVREIYEEFLSKGAKAEINIDGKTMEETRIAMKSPTRNTYDKAAEHVYLLLLKRDCFPRFIRSDHYKTLLTNAINPGSSRKRIFNFPQIRKKPSQTQNPHAQGAAGPGMGPNGINPEDYGSIYGMDGGETDEEKTPNNSETPRKRGQLLVEVSPVAGSGNGNDTCPWESPGPGPGPSSIEKSPKKDNDFHSDNNINAGNSFGNIGTASTSRVLPSRPVILSANPSSDSVTVVHPNSGDADLGQVELDLEKTCSETDNLITAQTTLDLGVEAKEDAIVTTETCTTAINQDSEGTLVCTGGEENGCGWISTSQDVCPWEDDSLTPTWL